MSNDNNNRVLGRMGARQLTPNEMDNVGGGGATLLSVIRTGSAAAPDQRLDS
ncbi:MAG TPA: hypothetical protein VJW55_20615 [Candidatus Angelobacter sp.]|nr:hypothetical protein [Candidatus Angelobacter sp.]